MGSYEVRFIVLREVRFAVLRNDWRDAGLQQSSYLFRRVVGRFAGDHHIVHVTLAQAGPLMRTKRVFCSNSGIVAQPQ